MANPILYDEHIQAIRHVEYPMLRDEIYLDHAGTTLYSKSLMEAFTKEMMSNLYGNPHSASPSSLSSSKRIDDIRLRVLQYFHADPEDFDVVFLANATAGLKLVMDAFTTAEHGFSFLYHRDSHTSLIGVREGASDSLCLSDQDVEHWLLDPSLYTPKIATRQRLFAYPAQSNMNGRRMPLSWSGTVRRLGNETSAVYTLLDAAAFVSTTSLNFSDCSEAPDFTILSFNKIFGFPDLGALIVRKQAGYVLKGRTYFGGGTVDAVVCDNSQPWHVQKEHNLHDSLEDGTLPIHNIIALDAAMTSHATLYESMDKISQHTMFLARRLYANLKALQHSNGISCCQMYSDEASFATDNAMQGPIIAFNLRNAHGRWHSNAEVERLAALKGIHIRTGGLCNPGGIADALNLSPQNLLANYAAGFRCGSDNDIMANGNPTGVIRASIGAMSTIKDVDAFHNFVREFYVETAVASLDTFESSATTNSGTHYIQSLTVYPVKSCGGYDIPNNVDWIVKPEGLVWDREWCLVHQGTGQALSQKRYPRMVLIRPSLDLEAELLNIEYVGTTSTTIATKLSIPLSYDPSHFVPKTSTRTCTSRVCGDNISAEVYASTTINQFFSDILDVPCALARFPAGGTGTSTRHSKAHLQRYQKVSSTRPPNTEHTSSPPTPPDSDTDDHHPPPILLSNESPILIANISSLHHLNKAISSNGHPAVSPSVFRANILIAPAFGCDSAMQDSSRPYIEDTYTTLTLPASGSRTSSTFKLLGACRRCHMVCIDPKTAEKYQEPFVTLSKTRRFDGGVFFGVHACLQRRGDATRECVVRVGDVFAGSVRGYAVN